ncbi:hypothetical protein BJX65DRAFT_291240 [Aspergillus insuetus]
MQILRLRHCRDLYALSNMSSSGSGYIAPGCLGFTGHCGCKHSFLHLKDMDKCDEHMLAGALLCVAARNAPMHAATRTLYYRDVVRASSEISDPHLEFTIQCDGSPTISCRWHFTGIHYYSVIHPLIRFMLQAWIRANPEECDTAKYVLAMVDDVLSLTATSPEVALIVIMRNYLNST